MLVKLKIVFALINIGVLCLGMKRENWPEYEYYPELQGWLKYHAEPADWLAARIYCHEEEALLVSPWSPAFTSAINKLQTAQQSPVLYSGVHTTFAEGVYRYINGKPVNSLNPSASEQWERCAVFHVNGSRSDVSCTDELPYVCYAAAPEAPACDHDYEWSAVTGNCYKFHEEKPTWLEAYKKCRTEGAHLAVVNSEAEAQFLATYFKTHSKVSMYYISIGFYYGKSSKSWRTIYGETLDQAGYDKWDDGEPNGTGNFGGIIRDGTFDDVGNTPAPFICEKEMRVVPSIWSK